VLRAWGHLFAAPARPAFHPAMMLSYAMVLSFLVIITHQCSPFSFACS
jgi:hypothetical protein